MKTEIKQTYGIQQNSFKKEVHSNKHPYQKTKRSQTTEI